MNGYLAEVEYAASNIIDLIWAEHNRITELAAEVARLQMVVEGNYQRAVALRDYSEDIDDVMDGVGAYWENYFGEDKELFLNRTDLEELQRQVAAHEYSIAALSGSLLQIAKQGVSSIHGGLAACPDGRLIGMQPLKTVIWQSRNQSMHWEDGAFHAATNAAFQALISEVDAKFAEYTIRDMAFDVVNLLGWTDFAAFRADMLTLQ